MEKFSTLIRQSQYYEKVEFLTTKTSVTIFPKNFQTRLPLLFLMVNESSSDESCVKLVAYNGKIIEKFTIDDKSENYEVMLRKICGVEIKYCHGVNRNPTDFYLKRHKNRIQDFIIENFEDETFLRSKNCCYAISDIENEFSRCLECRRLKDSLSAKLKPQRESTIANNKFLKRFSTVLPKPDTYTMTEETNNIKLEDLASHTELKKSKISQRKQLRLFSQRPRKKKLFKHLKNLKNDQIQYDVCQENDTSEKNAENSILVKDNGPSSDKINRLKFQREQKSKTRTCESCTQEFRGIRIFLNHFKTSPGCKDNLRSKNHQINNSSYYLNKGSYLCPICGKNYSCPSALDVHLGCIHGVESDGTTPVEQHICHICGNSYGHKLRLKEHIFIYHKSGKLKCDQCEKWFPVQNKLMTHQVSFHLKIRPFKCPVCDYEASEMSNVYKHCQKHHGYRATSKDVRVDREKLEIIREKLNYNYFGKTTDGNVS